MFDFSSHSVGGKRLRNLNLYKFRQEIMENDIILSFEGKISQGVLAALIRAMREKVLDTREDTSNEVQYNMRKICAILVELAQNIQKHSMEQSLLGNTSSGIGIIVIREDDHSFTLTSGNTIPMRNAGRLAAYCDRLNLLGKCELKALYKERLRRDRVHGDKGGGIGLIEIKRKSNQPLVYAMKVLDNETAFFSLSVNMTKTV